MTISISKEDLAALRDLAQQQVDDVSSGLEEGLYDEDDNQNHPANIELLARVDALLGVGGCPAE